MRISDWSSDVCSSDLVRMSDAELLTDCVLAMERGVVSTSASDLRSLYKRYDEVFPDAGHYQEQIQAAFGFIAEDLEVLRRSYMMKPYALNRSEEHPAEIPSLMRN